MGWEEFGDFRTGTGLLNPGGFAIYIPEQGNIEDADEELPKMLAHIEVPLHYQQMMKTYRPAPPSKFPGSVPDRTKMKLTHKKLRELKKQFKPYW